MTAPSGTGVPSAQAWLLLWVRPRRTMSALLERPVGWTPWLLVLFGGAAHALNVRLWRDALGAPARETVSLTAGLLQGALGGLVGMLLWPTLLALVGRLFGTRAAWGRVAVAYAWCQLLVAQGLLLWLPLVAFLGGDAFGTRIQWVSAPGSAQAAWNLWVATHAVLAAYACAVWVICLAAAQRGTRVRALATTIGVLLLVMAPVALWTRTG